MAVSRASLEFNWKFLTKRLGQLGFAQPTVNLGPAVWRWFGTILVEAGGRHKSVFEAGDPRTTHLKLKEKETPAMENHMESEAGRIPGLALPSL